jgi:hypothetical protein
MELGFENGDMYKKDMQADVHWRAPELHIENAKVFASVSFGPRVSLDIGLPGTELTTLSMIARFDIPKLEFQAEQTQSMSELSYSSPQS